jgi:hypothetical protein
VRRRNDASAQGSATWYLDRHQYRRMDRNNDDRLLEYIARSSVFPDYVSVNLSQKNAPAPSVDSDDCCAPPRRGIWPVKKGGRTPVQRPLQPRYEPSESLSMSRSASVSFSMAANTSSTSSSVLSRIVTDSMSFPSALRGSLMIRELIEKDFRLHRRLLFFPGILPVMVLLNDSS